MMGRILPLRRVQGVVTEMSDEALLAACALSDTAALGALYDRFHRPVFQFLMRYFGPGHPDIDDLVQSTFLEVQRSAGGFQGRSSVRAWILGIAANLARHHVRGESRRKVMLSSVATAPPRPSRSPDDHTEQRQLLQRMHQAITELPAELRGPLLLCDMEELPGAEAARVLGLREGTLWRRIHDARKRLRAILDDWERRAS